MQTLHNTAYLLVTSDDGAEWVQRYTRTEAAELFTVAERRRLDRGEAVIHLQRDRTGLRYVDMIAAARTVVA